MSLLRLVSFCFVSLSWYALLYRCFDIREEGNVFLLKLQGMLPPLLHWESFSKKRPPLFSIFLQETPYFNNGGLVLGLVPLNIMSPHVVLAAGQLSYLKEGLMSLKHRPEPPVSWPCQPEQKSTLKDNVYCIAKLTHTGRKLVSSL